MGLTEKINNTGINAKMQKISYDASEIETDIIPKLKEICKTSFHNFWEDKEEAKHLLELLEGNAVEVFVKHAAMQDFIMSNDTNWERLVPPFELTFNQDGTVTLKE